MKLCAIFLFLALLSAASAASIPLQHDQQQTSVFTSELDDSFVATLPKDASHLQDDKDNSLEPLAATQNKNLVKTSPAVVKVETHIPVAIVQEPEKIVTKKAETVKAEALLENKPCSEAATPNKLAAAVSSEDKPDLPNNPKPVDEKVEEVKQEEPLAAVKGLPIEGKKDQVTEVKDDKEPPPKQSAEASPAAPAPSVTQGSGTVSPPNFIQQGLMNIQQGIQNIGTSFASIVTPSNTSSASPNILQNLQQTLQNIVRPPAADGESTPAPAVPGIFEGIQNFSSGIQQSIQNLSQSFQNFLSETFGGQNAANPNRNATILQQGITSLQQGVQTGLQNLNQTIQSVTNPSPDRPNIIQSGIQNLQQGVQNITTGIQNIFRPANSDDSASRPGILQQTVQNLSQGLQAGVQSLNNTIQNLVTPSAVASGEGARPGVIQQGIQNIQTGLQNLIRRNETSTVAPAATRETIEQAFFNELRAINETLQAGVRELTRTLEGNVLPEQKSEPIPVVGEAIIVDA